MLDKVLDVSRKWSQRSQQKSVNQLQFMWWSFIQNVNFIGYLKQRLDG